MTRKEFEDTKWKMHPWDGLYINPSADTNCKICNGHGVIDLGFDTGCILENCPSCWVESLPNQQSQNPKGQS